MDDEQNAEGPEPTGDREPTGRGRAPVTVVLGIVLLVVLAVIGAVVAISLDDADTATTATTTTATATAKPTTTTEAATTTTAPGDQPVWPARVLGRPAAFGDDGTPPPAEVGDLAEGFYLWFDFSGWHLWLVGGQGSEATVEVQADDAISKADPVGGQPQVDLQRNRLVVGRGGAGEAVIGVDFNPGFYSRTLVVTRNGDLPVFLGANAEVGPEYLGLSLTGG